MKVTVLGAGAWGTALAQVLSLNGHQTQLWTWQESHADALNGAGENVEFLPGVALSDSLQFTSSLSGAVSGAEMLVLVVPSHAVGATMKQAAPFLGSETGVVCASKGIENGTLFLMSEVVTEAVTSNSDDAHAFAQRLAVLSGPSFAKEVARGVPTNLVAASENEEFSLSVQSVFSNQRLRVYIGKDPVGVEVGGALKNVIAIAAGACDGLGLGHNTRAALITRGVAEMSRLVEKMGGQASTMAGLAGMGDLVLTCTGDMSRNRTLGRKLGQGVSLEEAISSSDGVAEGYLSAKSTHELAAQLKVDLPICEAVYSVLYDGKEPKFALQSLLSRPLGRE